MWTHNVFELAVALFAGGVLCGALWSFLRIQRILLGVGERAEISAKKRKIYIFLFVLVQDVSFFAAAACVLAVAFYYGNNGNFRIFALLFAALGAVAYVKTVGRITERSVEKIRNLFIKFLNKLKSVYNRFVYKLKSKKLRKTELKNKEAVEIGEHKNRKIVGNKRGMPPSYRRI